MVQLHNCPEFVFAYLACHKTGLVFCPVNFRLSAKEIADCMDNSHPKVFLSEPEVQAEVDLALTRTGSAPQILLTTEETAPHSYTGFVADCPTDDPALSWELSIYDETRGFSPPAQRADRRAFASPASMRCFLPTM